jgi:hypothetical protein
LRVLNAQAIVISSWEREGSYRPAEELCEREGVKARNLLRERECKIEMLKDGMVKEDKDEIDKARRGFINARDRRHGEWIRENPPPKRR